ncbi:MAG: hypothetical protein Q4D02_04440 [Clostridia bacterium]|nr:hypothetical protein [Clostridia bacterium]
MGKLNLRECKLLYDPSTISLKVSDSNIEVNFDFRDNSKENSILKIILNTIFIQNLSLQFQSTIDTFLILELRKGEQNFVYHKLKFNAAQNITIPLQEMNPYTSSINIIILNNHHRGTLTIKKNLD